MCLFRDLWHASMRQSYPKSSVSPECCCSPSHWSRTTRSYLAGFVAVALASCTETCWLQTSMFCLLVFVWPGTEAPPYLADNIHLVSEGYRRRLRSPTDVCRFTHTQHVPRLELRCRRASCLSSPLVRWGHYTTVSGVNSKLFCFNVASVVQWDFC